MALLRYFSRTETRSSSKRKRSDSFIEEIETLPETTEEVTGPTQIEVVAEVHEGPAADPPLTQTIATPHGDGISTTTNQPSKRTANRQWNPDWLTQFHWLEYHDNLMFCKICVAASNKKSTKQNGFVLGSSTFQRYLELCFH